MSGKTNAYDLDLTFKLNAAPEKVFRALTDSEELEKWWPVKARVDPRKGGKFDLRFKTGFVLAGHIIGLSRLKSVSYSWIDNSVPIFTLKAINGGTVLRLTHKGIEEDGSARTASGWTYYLTNLKSVLDHGVDLRSKEDSF